VTKLPFFIIITRLKCVCAPTRGDVWVFDPESFWSEISGCGGRGAE